MAELQASLDTPPSGRSKAVWFDSLAYCRAKLLSGRPVPWAAPGELAAFTAKAQGMFHSDALLVDLADLFAWRASTDSELRAAMGARTRPGYALRTLLADEQARAAAVDAIRTTGAEGRTPPVIVCIPSPARWLTISAAQAGHEAEPPDADRADTAAMYIADFLRTFATTPVAGVLLHEGATEAAGLIGADAYRPVFNVTDHYGWSALICTEAARAWPSGAVAGVAAWIGSAPPVQPPGPWGLHAGDDFWGGGEARTDADFVLAVVPAQADPEVVMTRVRALS